MRKLSILLTIILIFQLLPVPAKGLTAEPIMTVKLRNYLGNQTQITLKTSGEYKTVDGKISLANGIEYKLKLEQTASNSSKLVLYKDSTRMTELDKVTILPSAGTNLLYINNRPYKGSFQFIQETTNNKTYIRPINFISMEEYLKGVVPKEMHASWHQEALKSQAVAARTYALSHSLGIIDDTISYQVYGGNDGHPNSDKAVSDTAGMVLKYNNRLITAVFSASNGGMTEANTNAWPPRDKTTLPLPYFPVQEDPFDPKTKWSFELNKQQIDLTNKSLSKPADWWSTTKEMDSTKPALANMKYWLSMNGYPDKEIKILSIDDFILTQPTSGGRVSEGSITIKFLAKGMMDANGDLKIQTVELKNVSASKIRAIIGIRIIQSYLIDKVDTSGDMIAVQGRGDGHAVGLSQWGAQKRAEAYHSFKDILTFYYPGTSLVKEFNLTTVNQPVISTPTPKTDSPAVVRDTAAPIIKNITSSFDKKTNKTKLSFHSNEKAKTTVFIKDNKNKVIKTLIDGKELPAGTNQLYWDVSKVVNGDYTAGIITTDLAGNKSSASQKLKVSKPVPPKKVTVTKTKTGTVKASTLNVRQKASTYSKVVGKVKKNQKVTVLSKSGSWYKIKYGKTTGYVYYKYLSVK